MSNGKGGNDMLLLSGKFILISIKLLSNLNDGFSSYLGKY